MTSTHQSFLFDVTDAEQFIYECVSPYTMTSIERIISLTRAVQYVIQNNFPGDFVECGVWRGGSMMAVALTLMDLGVVDRQLFLYDTFSGMSQPSSHDQQFDGTPAATLLETSPRDSHVWADASLEDVKQNVLATGYPTEQIRFIQGKVEDTIPQVMPSEICLLRLDTDWYESTKHELLHLYPRLVKNGILIIDDYGHWQGAKTATDEYFAQQTPAPFLHRIDYTGRLVVKI
ncbi:MAG: macrocin O-methyltransferase [Leptolyngbyaceae cyanobacterium SL_7_1]|nr:macrocin O-methyltransferase [Leptolyngbyaceae cyanobacterium SL_7_1]